MSNQGFRISARLFFLWTVSLIGTNYVMAQVPRTISYQGVLTQSNGTAVPDGNYNLLFKLYSDSSANATTLWSETQSVLVTKGIFNVILGNVNPMTLPFNKQYWLGITVGAGPEMSPRIELTSSPYSAHAIYADTIATPAGGDLTGTYPKLTIAGSAVTSGKIASGQVVKSINTLKDSVTLAAGSNVTITPTGNTLTISASGGSGGTITGITAGTGLTGGGTSGNVTLSLAVPVHLSGSYSGPLISGQNSSGAQGIVGSSSTGIGVYGYSTSSDGVYGIDANTNNYGYLGDPSEGVYGNSKNGSGVYGVNSGTNNYGILGNGSEGVYGKNANGNYGILGAISWGVQGVATSTGEGVSGWANGSAIGVYGYGVGGYAAWFDGPVQINGNYTATGTKNAEVKLDNGSPVLLYCEEATEVYFTDYGEGQLSNGRSHITIDPTFLQTVTIDAQNPMLIFIQTEGPCHGVYVTNRTSTGFDVVEQDGGTSNIAFAYRVVCKRKYFENERLSTPAQDDAATRAMMQKVWPEVIAKEQRMEAKMKAMEEQQKAMEAKINAGQQR